MKILHLEDTPADAHFIRELLTDELPLCQLTLVTNAPDYLVQLKEHKFDLILSDFRLKDIDGLQALELAQEHASNTPFIFLSGSIGEEIALQCVRAGAHDYVLKDRIKRLPTAIRHAVDEAKERQHRQAAEEAQGRLVDILENTPDFVGMSAPDGRMLYLNRAGLRLTNLAETTEVSKLLMHDFHPAQFSASLSDAFAEASRIGTWSGETLLLTRDGQSIPVSQVVIAHRSADTGNIEYFSTIMRDLSAQRAAQRRLREQADLLNKARDAIIVTDPEGGFTFWNRGAEHIFGWSAAEVVGRNLTADALPPESRDEINRARQTVEEIGEWQGELHLLNKARQPIVIETSITTIYDEAGLPSAHLTISTDITEKKKLQEQFFRAQRLESVGLLAAGIAHDLNNVLTPMLLAAPMLRESATSPGDRELLVALEEGVQRGAALVRQILGFVRGVSGPSQDIEPQPLLRAISKIIQGTFPKNIRLEEDIPSQLPSIKANPTQIHQVLLNLAV
ncbi:MAG: PAS domain S-box protein, partial [Pseudomonadota bacterium]